MVEPPLERKVSSILRKGLIKIGVPARSEILQREGLGNSCGTRPDDGEYSQFPEQGRVVGYFKFGASVRRFTSFDFFRNLDSYHPR